MADEKVVKVEGVVKSIVPPSAPGRPLKITIETSEGEKDVAVWDDVKCDARVGDGVQISGVEKEYGGKKYISVGRGGRIEVIPAPPSAQTEKPAVDKDRVIARESLISSLCTLYSGASVDLDVEEIVRRAKRLEQYVYHGT